MGIDKRFVHFYLFIYLFLTCLDGDRCRVSYEAGIDGVDSEGIVCFRAQLRH